MINLLQEAWFWFWAIPTVFFRFLMCVCLAMIAGPRAALDEWEGYE